MKRSNWYIFLVNGLIAILFGIILLLIKQTTINSTVRIFGGVIALSGLILFYISYRNMKSKKSYLMLMIEAIVAVLIGLIIAINPGQSFRLFMTLVGIWAAIMGLLQIIISLRMKKKVSNHLLFTVNGIITLVIGLLLFNSSVDTMGTLMKVVGILSLVAGSLMLYLGIMVKGIKE